MTKRCCRPVQRTFGVGEKQYDSFWMKLHSKMYVGNKPKVLQFLMALEFMKPD